MSSLYSVNYEMRCRNCGEGRQFTQQSYYYHKSDFTSDQQTDSEYSQAEHLAESLQKTGITCDWCGVALWDIHSIKIDGKPLMCFADNLLYYAVLIDKDEDEGISFDEQGDQSIPWRTCHEALSNIYHSVKTTDEKRFGSNSLDFGGDAELIVSFNKEIDGKLIFNRIEKICFIGFDKADLLDAIAYTNNNLYAPNLPRVPAN